MPLGLSSRDLLRLAREARSASEPRPLLVLGPLARELTRVLTAGGDSGLVRTAGDPAHASALVCLLAGEPREEQIAELRAATRACVPVVAVQTGRSDERIPYVLAGDVVACPPGEGFPIEAIADALARVLGRDAAGLAARLPVLRRRVQERLVVEECARAAALAAVPWIRTAHLPLLVMLQARMLQAVAAAGGRAAPQTPQQIGLALGPEVASAVAAGLAGRSLYRAVPFDGPAVRAAIAAAGTGVLGWGQSVRSWT